MKIVSVSATNFGSYKNISFDFSKGLTLVHGATGSGKSTLCDMIPWGLFGKTSKGGSADEIRSWGEKSPTEVIVVFDNDTYVTRVRGKQNDLYLTTTDIAELRGKDMLDTQKIINEYIGFDLQVYLSGCYINEFSQVAQFFTTTAKVRRNITEQIVDLSLVNRLTASIAERRKHIKLNLEEIKSQIQAKTELLAYMEKQDKSLEANRLGWEELRVKRLDHVKVQVEMFEENRVQTILSLTDRASKLSEQHKNTPESVPCKECGNEPSKDHKHKIELEIDMLIKQAELEESRKNTYESRMREIQQETNPYTKKSDSGKTKLHLRGLEIALKQASADMTDADLLTKAIEQMRVVQIEDSVHQLESITNSVLQKHFDGEIKVALKSEDKDRLEVEVYKDGNLASYTQLSKGQRQMLKLSFGVSVMKQVSQFNSVNFNTIWFDECLDGCSDEVRIKAYGLFEELSLSYENIFCIDHSESFKACFVNKLMVKSVNGRSEIG